MQGIAEPGSHLIEPAVFNHTCLTELFLSHGVANMRFYLFPLSFLSLLVSAAFADEAEHKAIGFVQRLGGTVELDDKAKGKPIVRVDLEFKDLTDAGMKELVPFKHLKDLQISSTKVTDAGLKEVATFKELKSISIAHTKVTDAGLKELTGLKELVWLDLDFTLVTDVGLKQLTGLKQLEYLYLSNTKVTDAGLKELATMKQLQLIWLRGTHVTDAGIKELEKALPKCGIAAPLPEAEPVREKKDVKSK